jgi:hypothetical protein
VCIVHVISLSQITHNTHSSTSTWAIFTAWKHFFYWSVLNTRPHGSLSKYHSLAMKILQCQIFRFHTVQVLVILRPTVCRPICLGVGRPSGTRDRFFFLLEISFRQLRVCYFVAPSLTRSRVCNLLYNCSWALPEQLLLGRSPAELTAIFYCHIWDSSNLEGLVPVFISSRNRVDQLHPRALGSLFVASYDSQSCGGGVLTRLQTS